MNQKVTELEELNQILEESSELLASEPIEFYNYRYNDNPVVKKSWEFALNVIDFTDYLESERRYVLARQIQRCGTSIGANVREAQNAESLADFIHKNKIALKEADESEYFLSLCQAKNINGADELRKSAYELVRILNSIIASSKRKLNLK